MDTIKRAFDYFINNKGQFYDSLVRRLLFFLPDKWYLSLRFRCLMGYWIDWNNPKTFSEKLQWLKLYNRRPIYTTMVDKVSVKKYVAEQIGEEYVIPTLGVWDTPNDINWEDLPNQFVLKTTNGGGGNGVIICKNRREIDLKQTIESLNKALSIDIYKNYREWPYMNVSPKIIAEQFIHTDSSDDLFDYKFFCFNGKVKFFKVDFGRFIEHHANYFSVTGEPLNIGEANFPPVPTHRIELPFNLEKMIELAEKLAENEPFLRVDFYNIGGMIYFGELTLYPASGMGKWTPNGTDLTIGEYLSLNNRVS